MRFPAVFGLFASAMVVYLEREDKAAFVMPGSRIRACAHDSTGVSSRHLLPSRASIGGYK
jgi:hypothetical protein